MASSAEILRRGGILVTLALLVFAAGWVGFVLRHSSARLGAPADPSGEPMPRGNIPGWHQVFADDFAEGDVPLGGFSGCSGRAADLTHASCSGLRRTSYFKRWWAYPDGWHDGSGGTYYPSRVISIKNGVMDLHIRTAMIDGALVHLVAAPVPKVPDGVNGGGLRYGRYVVRFRSDALHGYKTAWLLWPDSGVWPRDGEIDFPEGDLDGRISAFIHWQVGGSGEGHEAFRTNATYSAWHTATIEWTPGMCRFILDGRLVGTAYRHVPTHPMHWVLQTQVSTDGNVPSDSTAGNVQIDWVAVYVPTRARLSAK